MSKALQKHMVAHLPEGAEEDGGGVTKKRQLKKDGEKMFHIIDCDSSSYVLKWHNIF